jgi:hypothetical protein
LQSLFKVRLFGRGRGPVPGCRHTSTAAGAVLKSQEFGVRIRLIRDEVTKLLIVFEVLQLRLCGTSLRRIILLKFVYTQLNESTPLYPVFTRCLFPMNSVALYIGVYDLYITPSLVHVSGTAHHRRNERLGLAVANYALAPFCYETLWEMRGKRCNVIGLTHCDGTPSNGTVQYQGKRWMAH